MNKTIFPYVAFLFASFSLPSLGQQYTNQYEYFKTLDGAEYRQVALKRREGNGIVIFHSSGINKVPIAQLPDNIRVDIGLPTSADLARQAEEESRMATERLEQEKKNLAIQMKLEEERQAKRELEAAKVPKYPTKVSRSQYNRITMGMSYSQVVSILGPPFEELSRSEMMGITTVMYMWEGNGFGGNMNIMMQNGEVINKAQFGLE